MDKDLRRNLADAVDLREAFRVEHDAVVGGRRPAHRLRKGGVNRERAWRDVERIHDRMAEVIPARRDGIATRLAADRLAEPWLDMARSLRMI